MRLTAIIITASLLISACSSFTYQSPEEKAAEKTKEEASALSEKKLRAKIKRNLDSRNWTDALVNLNTFEAQFPFGNYSDQAQLEVIYVYHESGDHDLAIVSAERFIRLHPRHQNVDYAYYMKGLSETLQHKGLFSERSPVDATKRDPGSARAAFATFSELISLYPKSPYAADARKRMIDLRNQLARHEIHVANYYFKRKAYLAAANRGRYVVENFQQSPAIPDGLAVMAQAYKLLNMDDLAQQAEQTLVKNYPNHPALNTQGEFQYKTADSVKSDSWLSLLSARYYVPANPPQFDNRELSPPK